MPKPKKSTKGCNSGKVGAMQTPARIGKIGR